MTAGGIPVPVRPEVDPVVQMMVMAENEYEGLTRAEI